jgi:hypothetical protein
VIELLEIELLLMVTLKERVDVYFMVLSQNFFLTEEIYAKPDETLDNLAET